MIEINEVDGAVEFQIRVIPRASKTEIVGELAGAVKVRVSHRRLTERQMRSW